ncbi:MAG: hypothetical protein IJ927_00290, partial [Eubacterium sp.]|nr:hypothetical protein [Eubacterium sp.]
RLFQIEKKKRSEVPKTQYRGGFERFYVFGGIFLLLLPCISQNINFAKLCIFLNSHYLPCREQFIFSMQQL